MCILEAPKSDVLLFFLQKCYANVIAISNLTGSNMQSCFKLPSISLNMCQKIQKLYLKLWLKYFIALDNNLFPKEIELWFYGTISYNIIDKEDIQFHCKGDVVAQFRGPDSKELDLMVLWVFVYFCSSTISQWKSSELCYTVLGYSYVQATQHLFELLRVGKGVKFKSGII